jgi:DNA segregation ATPase FtsK/SpoIIIE, S-DNA-T family
VPTSNSRSDLHALAAEFFGGLRSAERLVALSRDQITAEYELAEQAAAQHRDLASAESQKRHTEVAKKELLRLVWNEPPSQLDWWNSNLRPFVESSGGGIASRNLRLGSIAADITHKRVRIPLCMDIESGPCIIALEQGGRVEDALAVFRSLVLRFLISVRPTILGLRCFDGKDHGAAFNSFIQNLPARISGGVAGTTPKEFDERIAELDARIAFVAQCRLNDKHRTLVEANFDRQGDLDSYFLLAAANVPDGIDEQRVDKLLKVMAAGPRAGVFSVCLVNDLVGLTKRSPWRDVAERAFLINVGKVISIKQGRFELTHEVSIDKAPDEEIRNRLCTQIGKAYSELVNPIIHAAIPPKDKWWFARADEELAVEIGTGGDGQPQYFRLNEERLTGALIAGSSGTGKTNLLRLIIAGLILRYSPQHLHLYLFDLKGVDFNVFDEVDVPHVRMIVSEISQELGLAALRNFRELLAERKKLVASAGAQKLSEYNRKNPTAIIPRVVIVIDEFQILFDGDVMAAKEAASIIILIMKQGRSYGIHLVMASQNLGPDTTPKDVKSNCPCRIALSFNSPADYRMVFEAEPPAEMLPAKWGGTVQIANEGFARFSIPYLAVQQLRSSLQELSHFALERGLRGDKGVFISGTTTARLDRNIPLTRTLDGARASGDPTLWLGDTVSLGGYARFDLPAQRDSNLLVVTQRRNYSIAYSMALVSALSILAHSKTNRCFIFGANAIPDGDAQLINSIARALPDRCFVYTADDVSALEMLAKEISAGGPLEPNTKRTVLFLPALDRHREFDPVFRTLYNPPKAFGTQQLSAEQARRATLCERFRMVLENGPVHGVHSIILLESLAGIERQTLSRFNLCAATCLTESDSKTLFGASQAAALEDNFAVAIDRSTQTDPVRFRPYANVDERWLGECLKKLQ